MSLNNNIQTDLLLLDLSKAFDKVSHSRLLYKLQHYGINGPQFNWIKGCLSDRVQNIVLDGASSTSLEVISGAPQGSASGPLLFMFYINDL